MTDSKTAHKILRVLILDDSPDDAEQASAALRHAGYMLKTQRLETGVAVEQNLDAGTWDLVLCAHGMTGLPVRQVVELVAKKQPFVPVIVLARRIADDELRTLMQAGARDAILKGQWGRLVPAVERELAVADERRALHETREAMRQLEGRYRSMIESSLEAISYVQDGMHMDANASYLRLFGYDNLENLKELPLLNLIDRTDQARFKQALKKPEGADKAQEFQAVTAGGNRITVEVAITPLTINGEPCVQVVATDISKRKALESKLQSMHQRDALTGLYNRGHFLTGLDEALKAPGGVVIAINVQGLAELNQNLGHTACDRMLVQLARHLRDVTGNHMAARLGGGQFAVLVDAKAAAGAEALVRKIGEATGTVSAGEGDKTVKPEIGVAPCKLDGQHKDRQALVDQLFKVEAPAAAPAARPAPAAPAPAATPPPAAKPAPAVVATAAPTPAPSIAPASAKASDWRDALSQTLAANKMELLFQPMINLHGEPRSFYQAQLMLRTGDGTLVPAREYMPSAEASGLAGKIDRNMMLNVIDTLSKYQLEGRAAIAFVGLSPAAVQDNALLAAIQMHMKATGLDPANLVLELDEASLAKHLDSARAFIQKAQSLGVGIGLHHFTNQALSIEALAALPIDYFAVDCSPDGLEEEVLFGAIDAVRALDKLIIARGLEDADLFSTLFSRGVHYVQGDYLQPATSGLDYSFEADQTLTSDEPSGPSWRVAG
jgi:PAS domain S-box-containing protein/diguanylate cyclase (GGDEF)-like protein